MNSDDENRSYYILNNLKYVKFYSCIKKISRKIWAAEFHRYL